MNDVRSLILELAVEDFYGLWELVWRLQTRESGLSRERAVQAARSALAALHEQDLVELYRGTKGDPLPIRAADVPALLAEETSWEEPKEGTGTLLVGATQKGEEAYYKA